MGVGVAKILKQSIYGYKLGRGVIER